MKRTLGILMAILMIATMIPALGTAEGGDLTILKVMAPERLIQDTFFAERDKYVVWQAAEKLFAENGVGFDFEIIADTEQYKSTLQTRLAAGHDLPDMLYLGTMKDNEVLELADMGIILPMNEVLETTKGAAYDYFYGGEGEKARQLLTSEDGNFYWLPRIQMNLLEGTEQGTSMGICIRQDWLDKLGLEIPQTLDEFTDALRAFRENDVNESGAVDEVLALDTAGFKNGLNYWFGMVNDYVGVNIEAGTVESPWYSPVAKDYFRYIQALVEEGLLYPDAIGVDADSFDNAIKIIRTENKISALYYYPVGTYVENEVRATAADGTQGKEAEYSGIYPFAAEEGVTPFYSEETPYLVYLKHGVTSAAADKLEAVAKVYDTIYSPEYINIMDWGVEGETYEVVDGQNVLTTFTMTFAEKAASGKSKIDELARYFFPNLYHNERLFEIENTKDWPNKQAFEMATKDYPNKTPNDNTGYYALPTAEQSAYLDSHLTDLETYSRETAANLSLGRLDVDADWDTIIETLKSLGLDEVIAIRQDQLDRANGK